MTPQALPHFASPNLPNKRPLLLRPDVCTLKAMETPPVQDLSDLRKSKGFTQWGLARRLGIARTELCKIESGRIRPSLEEVRLIAQALEVAESEVIQAAEQVGSKLWTPKSERQSPSREVAQSGFQEESAEVQPGGT